MDDELVSFINSNRDLIDLVTNLIPIALFVKGREVGISIAKMPTRTCWPSAANRSSARPRTKESERSIWPRQRLHCLEGILGFGEGNTTMWRRLLSLRRRRVCYSAAGDMAGRWAQSRRTLATDMGLLPIDFA